MRIHLYETEEPLDKPKAVTAICGRTVSPVGVVYQRDGQVFDRFLVNTTVFCKQCFEQTRLNKRYLYGIVNAQDLDSLRGKEE